MHAVQVILFWFANKLKPGFVEACFMEGGAPEEVAEQLWTSVAVSPQPLWLAGWPAGRPASFLGEFPAAQVA